MQNLDHLSRIKIGEEPSSLEDGLPDAQVFAVCITDNYFTNIIQLLMTRTSLKGYTTQQKKELVVHAKDFLVIVGNLYKMGFNEILQIYVPEFECASILAEAHGEVARGHYSGKAIAQNILHTRLWWPTLHEDSKAYCKVCYAFQRMG